MSGLKARGERRDAPGKVLKDRRSPRRRGRMGTSVWDAPEIRVLVRAPEELDDIARGLARASEALEDDDDEKRREEKRRRGEGDGTVGGRAHGGRREDVRWRESGRGPRGEE